MGWNCVSILNVNCASVKVLEWIGNVIPHFYLTCDYVSLLGLKLKSVFPSSYRARAVGNTGVLSSAPGGNKNMIVNFDILASQQR